MEKRRGEAVVEAVVSWAGEMAKRRRCSREAPVSGVRPAAARLLRRPKAQVTLLYVMVPYDFLIQIVFLRDEEEKNIIITPGKVIYLFIVKKIDLYSNDVALYEEKFYILLLVGDRSYELSSTNMEYVGRE